MIVRNISILIVGLLLVLTMPAFAQIEALQQKCESYFPTQYISDGQEYRTLLSGEDVGEFRVVFYGGSTYRLAIISSAEANKVYFTVYDEQRNEIFSNRDHNETPYWDFKFTSTMTCVIETQLPAGTNSGVAILLVAFKQQ